jgi:predicted small lipoprotein YifL
MKRAFSTLFAVLALVVLATSATACGGARGCDCPHFSASR